MRAAPVGLLLAHDRELMARTAHDQGRITHTDPRCSAGAITIAGATAIVVREGRIEAGPLCAELAELTRPFDPVLAEALGRLPRWADEPPDRAVARIAPIGMESFAGGQWSGVSPFVTPSVLWSLYSVLRSPADYWETICTAIQVGGDVDTTAAMAGAISGATIGLAGIPPEAARLVSDRGSYGFEALVELAGELHHLHRRLRGL